MAANNKRQFELGFSIGGKVASSFSNAFKGVERQLAATKRAVGNAGKAWANFGRQAGKLMLGATGTATTVGLAAWRMANDIASAGDRVAQNAARVRMSNEAYQGLEFAFRRAGFAADEFSRMMEGMDRTIRDAAASDRGMQRFAEEFGLSAKKLNAMDPAKRIERLTDYLNYLEDPLKRDRLSMELFGRAWSDMSQVLGQGSEGLREAAEMAARTGNILSDETIKASQAYEQARRDIRASIDGIKNQLFANLVPHFTRAFEQVNERLQSVDWAAWGDKIAGWAEAAVPKIKETAKRIGELAGKVRDGVLHVRDFVGGWGNVGKIAAGLVGAKTAISGVKAAVATFKVGLTLLNPALKGLNLLWKLGPFGKVALVMAGIFAIVKGVKWLAGNFEWAERIFGRVKDAITGFFSNVAETFSNIGGKISDTWNAARERTSSFVSGAADMFERLPIPAARVFGLIRRSVNENWDSSASLTENLRNVVSGAFENIRGSAAEKFSAVRDAIGSNWDSSASLTENLRNVVSGAFENIRGSAAEKFSAVRDAIGSNWDSSASLTENFINAAKGLFGLLPEGIREKVSSVIGIFSGAWDRASSDIQAFVQRVIDFFSPVTRVIEGIGNAVGNLFSRGGGSGGGQGRGGGSGGGRGRGGVPAYASGGIVTRPHFGLVGEAGPEAIIPLKNNKNSRGLWEKAGSLAGFAPKYKEPSKNQRTGSFAGPAGKEGFNGLLGKLGSFAGLAPARSDEAKGLTNFAPAYGEPSKGGFSGLLDKLGSLMGLSPGMASGGDNITIPINVSVNVPGGGPDAAGQVQAAGDDIAKQVKAIVKGEVPNILSELKRAKIRTAF